MSGVMSYDLSVAFFVPPCGTVSYTHLDVYKRQQVGLSWKYVDALKDAYRRNGRPVFSYEQGCSGPKEAEQLLAGYGHSWFDK